MAVGRASVTPVPDNAEVSDLVSPLPSTPLTDSVLEAAPSAVGVNVTETVQVSSLARSAAAHPFVAIANGAATVGTPTSTDEPAAPVLVTVKTCVAVPLFVSTSPKLKVAGVIVSSPAGPAVPVPFSVMFSVPALLVISN